MKQGEATGMPGDQGRLWRARAGARRALYSASIPQKHLIAAIALQDDFQPARQRLSNQEQRDIGCVGKGLVVVVNKLLDQPRKVGSRHRNFLVVRFEPPGYDTRQLLVAITETVFEGHGESSDRASTMARGISRNTARIDASAKQYPYRHIRHHLPANGGFREATDLLDSRAVFDLTGTTWLTLQNRSRRNSPP